ncbi:DUF2892 domain-containing protein [Bacillus sp. WP8]|uniref:DUF2892 domain-containing protein n=1 Tax=Bacillus sp. WP8 TaxID=756828 RepID=UPI0021B6DC9B|nr:DUF2892 domain-containing protein [Bacillus sp. WP8]
MIRIAWGMRICSVAGCLYSRKGWSKMVVLGMMFGGMKVGCGIVGFCGVRYMCEEEKRHKEKGE